MRPPARRAPTSSASPWASTDASADADAKRSRRIDVFGMSLAAPAVLYFACWVFIPLGYSFYLSLTNANLLSPPQFIGLDNYSFLLSNDLWWSSLARTAVYAAEVVVPTLLASFLLARLVVRGCRGKAAFMTIYFLPYVIPGAAAALVFALMLQQQGPINQFLGTTIAWLGDPDFALIGVSVATIWSMVGFYFVVFMAGFQQLPHELIEAASLDGAGVLRIVRHIELPLLRPTLLFCLVAVTADVLTNFGTVYVMTNGGPGTATLTLPLLIYREIFRYSSAGLGAAMAMVLLAIGLILAAIQLRLFRRSG